MQTAIHKDNASADSPRSVTVFGSNKVVYLAVSEDTDGAYSLFEATISPDQGVPTHVHSREDESFYVLDGTLNIQIGEQSFTATRGWFGFGLRHIPHGFKATGRSPARMLIIVTPGGFERFFDELADLTASPPFDFDEVRALFEKYGMQIIEPK
jgi:quercetin dioxygenase-like cupin family protein